MPIDCYGLHPAASTSLTVKYVFFSFGHYSVYPSSIYGFWLPL